MIAVTLQMRRSVNERLVIANRSLSNYNLVIGIENVGFMECNKFYVSFHIMSIAL